jgi:hypothetical protein
MYSIRKIITFILALIRRKAKVSQTKVFDELTCSVMVYLLHLDYRYCLPFFFSFR